MTSTQDDTDEKKEGEMNPTLFNISKMKSNVDLNSNSNTVKNGGTTPMNKFKDMFADSEA